jgi:hypothetical protein
MFCSYLEFLALDKIQKPCEYKKVSLLIFYAQYFLKYEYDRLDSVIKMCCYETLIIIYRNVSYL